MRVCRPRTCGSTLLTLMCVGCASAPPGHVGWERVFWEQQACFAHVPPGQRYLESSKLEGSVFTAGYSAAEFPVAVAVVYVRRWANGKVTTADVDQDGRFAVPDAPEGLYELGVCANGWTPWRGTVRLRRDAPTGALELPLELGM